LKKFNTIPSPWQKNWVIVACNHLSFFSPRPSLKLPKKAQNAMLSLKFGKIDLEIMCIQLVHCHCVQKFKCIAYCMPNFNHCPHIVFTFACDCITFDLYITPILQIITIPSLLQRVQSPQKIEKFRIKPIPHYIEYWPSLRIKSI